MKSQSFVRHNRLKIILSKLADIFLNPVKIRIEINDGHLRPVELFLAKVYGVKVWTNPNPRHAISVER